MAIQPFKPVDIEYALSKLTLSEKTRLLAGSGWWQTLSIERLGIISMRCSDGPNGVRVFESTPAACFPCATGLASSWDVELARKVGKTIAWDCKAKGIHILLGPTVNIQRSPLGGRGFESYSEDPLLSGLTARAFIEGVQSEGVAATIKHYVCNDSEFERMSISSEVSTRALREIYLRPFELACRDVTSPAWAIMAGYNRVNGVHASEHKYLLDTILRQEWGWDGLIMSDWYGTYSADKSIIAGLDLEMPGPPLWRADALQRCVVAQKVRVEEIDSRVRQVLKLVNKAAASGIPENVKESGESTEEVVKLLRESAGNANVLLKNDIGLLPLSTSLKSLAVIGPNADAPVYSGGGSANIRPYSHTSPLEGIRVALSDIVKLEHVTGALAHKQTPLLGHKQLRARDGSPGFDIDWFHKDPMGISNTKKVHHTIGTNSSCWFVDNLPDDLSLWCWATMSATYTPTVSGKYEFGAMADGLIDMYVNGTKIIDNSTSPIPGPGFFGTASREVLGTINLRANEPAQVVLQYASSSIAHSRGYRRTNLDAIPDIRGSCRFGGGRLFSEDEGIQEAVDAAKKSDATVLVIGLNNDWETEGEDRANMSLPGAINRLVSAVLEANKRTAIVVISGTPVSMPWAASASTIVQSFYSGRGWARIGGYAVWKNQPECQATPDIPKTEGIFVGYRHYEAHGKDTLFPFGFGLSYTQFEYSNLVLTGTIGKDGAVIASVTVGNVGKRSGREVVQIYIKDLVSRLNRPIKELKGYAKTVLIDPGQSDTVEIALDRYAFAYFDDLVDGSGRWTAEAGEFEVIVGASSMDERLRANISLEESFDWI